MNEQKLKWIQEQLAVKAMVLAREAQLEDLRKYEKEINEIDPHAHVSVINEVDLEVRTLSSDWSILYALL